MFLGDELQAVLDAIETDTPYGGTEKTTMKLGVHVLPRFQRDNTDRNRTSPFAFTGNKFEFRMLGSSNSIACANIMLNSAVAESLRQFADELEKADDFNAALHDVIRRTIREHKRIIFNGNGYDDSWIKEATEVRGLMNLRTTPDAMPHLLDKKNVDMLTAHKVYSEAELKSRTEIMLENYVKTVNIEAKTMVEMSRKMIMPAIDEYIADLSEAAYKKMGIGIPYTYEKKIIEKLSKLLEDIDAATDDLEGAIEEYKKIEDVTKASFFIRDEILPRMDALRAPADAAEAITAEKYWKYPTYGKLLFGVR